MPDSRDNYYGTSIAIFAIASVSFTRESLLRAALQGVQIASSLDARVRVNIL